MSATCGGGPAKVPNLRVCKPLTCLWSGTRRGRANQRPAVVPSSRRGNTSSEPQRRENRAARKGKWSPRGTGTTFLTYPCPSQPCFGGSKGCARVTGKAGENGQHSGEMDSISPWTRPSAPWCGDTLKALASDQRSIKGGDRPRRRLQGRHRLDHRPVVLLRAETARCTVRPL